MFLKKALNSFAILRSSKMPTLLTVILLGSFDDLSFIFPTSSLSRPEVFCKKGVSKNFVKTWQESVGDFKIDVIKKTLKALSEKRLRDR